MCLDVLLKFNPSKSFRLTLVALLDALDFDVLLKSISSRSSRLPADVVVVSDGAAVVDEDCADPAST